MSQAIRRSNLEKFLRGREFRELFIALGWDTEGISDESISLSISPKNAIEKEFFDVRKVVEKRGFVICVCDAEEQYPTDRGERKKLMRSLAKVHYEHLLIMLGEGKQCWMVSIRPQDRPMRTIEVEWNESQDIQRLMEKLHGMIFDISEEEKLGITDVVDRVRHAFMENSEEITKRFYVKFGEKLSEFTEFIEGITEQVSKEWYAALMLNRLMFIYFIQKKGFLDGDEDYLKNRLEQTREKLGVDKFYESFYRSFLRRLFTEGLGAPESEREPELKELLGKIPYLNGGLFDLHEIERENTDIDIKDKAFEKLFKFFKQYNWHLDTSSTASGKDINPDVIGYIFEKYINDRAKMGAYYTKEDITGYIARNTIIPFLLDRAKKECANAFDAETGIYRFLRDNPDNYIYDAVKKGCNIPDEEIPDNIRCGIDTTAPNLIERRKDWNTKAEERFALPTEIWRETMARRKRYFELMEKIQNRDIHEIDDLITYNLNIERFVSNALAWYEGSDFIAAFYKAIAGKEPLQSNQHKKRGITILDPACGSGAFLFAALSILEPLYENCIERMKEFVDEHDKLSEQSKKKGTKKHQHFRKVLDDIDVHPNRRYWIYKTIILNNLYGVDLMQEAVEVTKLRLFLKLAAVAEYDPDGSNLGLEPLPDIDFNIRCGNSLVGFASMKQFEEFISTDASGQDKIGFDEELVKEICEESEDVQKVHDRFKKAQDIGSETYQNEKSKLKVRLAELNKKMNNHLARQYGRNGEENDPAYEEWLRSHRPFHWLTEFYGIIEYGNGFDVVIGNPPYIEYSTVKNTYTIHDYVTEKCGNLYAMIIERAQKLCGAGRTGMIVQLPIVCTNRMIPLQRLFLRENKSSWFLNFDDRPAKLFQDLQHIRASVFLTSPNSCALFSTLYRRWNAEIRFAIFQHVILEPIKNHVLPGIFPKIGEQQGIEILDKLKRISASKKFRTSSGNTGHMCYFHNAPQYWIRATDFVPHFWNERHGQKRSSHLKELSFSDELQTRAACAVINSSLFYWWFIVCSDCRDLNLREIVSFPIDLEKFSLNYKTEIHGIVTELMENYREHSTRKKTTYKTTGKVIYDEFYPRHGKHIIDKIDVLLAEHYSFTEGELNYIINYDIKYRLGLYK